MNKRGFTLIELMVSIALTVIVVLFLYKALSNQEIANEVIAKKALKIEQKEKLFELLYRDLSQAQEIKVEPVFNRDYRLLFLHTTNSLHQIPMPYVAYFVHENNRTLVRLESAYSFKFPVEPEKIKYIFADPLVAQVEKFIVLEDMQGGRKRRELLPGERPPKAKDQNGSKEYLLFLKWQDERLVIDIKK